MQNQGASPKGLTPATSPRANVTPPGHKNVRVFIPQRLHFQLVSYSAASEMSLNDFVVAWLERATPLEQGSSPQGGTPSPATLIAKVAMDTRPIQAEASSKAAGLGQVPHSATSDSLATPPDTSPAQFLALDPAPAEGGSRA